MLSEGPRLDDRVRDRFVFLSLHGLLVLVQERLLVETEITRVDVEEPAGVDGGRQRLPAILLHRLQELGADLRGPLNFAQLDAALRPGFAQGSTDTRCHINAQLSSAKRERSGRLRAPQRGDPLTAPL